MKRLVTTVATVAALSMGSAATAATVSLELLLLTDVSGSVDSTDFDLITGGYAAAFESAAVHDKILTSSTGSIAVAVGQYASDYEGLSIGWTLIDSVASSNAFAASLRSMTRLASGGTNITAGVAGGAAEFASNAFDGLRTVMDIVGDGEDSVSCPSGTSVCVPLQNARDAALSGDVDVINALFVNDRGFFGDTGSETVDSIAYGTDNVIGGPGAFVETVGSFLDFEIGIESKIIREVDPTPVVPVPAALPLLATGFAAFGLLRARRRKSVA